MLFHNTPRYTLYFGNAHDAIHLDTQTREKITINPFQIPIFQTLQKIMSLSDIIFLHQIHGTNGLVIDNKNSLPIKNLTIDGDFIVTNLLHVGIGVFTADCLPIICYDSVHHVAAIAHAGWKGALTGIIPAMINTLQRQFKTDLSQLVFFFGPSAKQCCYEVKDDFTEMLQTYSFAQKVMHRVNNRLFFNLPLFAQLHLKSLGISLSACHITYNSCTICDPQYFSHRRQQKDSGRQVTLIALK